MSAIDDDTMMDTERDKICLQSFESATNSFEQARLYKLAKCTSKLATHYSQEQPRKFSFGTAITFMA